MISGKSYIGYRLSTETEKSFNTFNPISNQKNEWTFYEPSFEEIDEAVNLASSAFQEFKKISGKAKGQFLNAIADEIELLGDLLITVYGKETGLPEGRAKGERGRTIFQLRSFAALVEEGSWVQATVDKGIPNRTPIPKPDLRKMMVPLGPVVVFGASNFPLAYSTAGGDTASALASGSPVIVKSHPMHAGTSELVASAIIEAAKKTGMPNGVFSNINSSGIEVGAYLTAHPKIKAVGFTGSVAGGRALLDLASKREEPIPVFAEMGSINPVVILPEALQQRHLNLATTYASSITLGTGQFCTNPGLILGVAGEALEAFSNELAKEIVKISPTSMLHPQIKKNYNRNRAAILEQEGVTTIAAYKEALPDNFANQSLVTVTGAHFLKNSKLHQEVFGPFSIIVQCKDVKELVTILLALEGQLTGTIIAEESELVAYKNVIDALQNRVGRLIFNGVPTGVEVCPSMQHGGPYPASTDSRFTAVGIHSIYRWVRPVSYQNWPDEMLPEELKDSNPLQIDRLIDGEVSKASIQ